MSNPTEYEVLDGEFTVMLNDPTEVSELVEMIGAEAVVENTVANLHTRNRLPRLYKKVSEEVSKEFPRAVKSEKTNKDGTKSQILVSYNDHLRAYSQSSDEAKQKVGELFSSIAPKEALHVKGERTGGGGRIGQAALDAANAIIADGEEKVAAVVEYIESETPGYKVGRDGGDAVTPESLARGIQAMHKYAEAKAKREREEKLKKLGV